MQQDLIVSQMNEYEILQIMMGDCREKLGGYSGNREDEIKVLQRAAELTPREYAASKLRTCEKRILGETMKAVRKRLAPIRGIPTKQGMEAPNADIVEIFDTIEAIPEMPKQMWKSFSSWARGDHDK
ncbi:hypothetical protein CYMTET_56650 [Cymbomonas tetramitiformis]|uniref:Rubisco LSMT substrate-binding domain-containing protein n=1 Tax=Cymbomonas tetramitiformis TaxID=36881 RepID=A0AAE0EM38_9CHLO|nr:hypothetical protein CYMTET_56650 [Cymbomonas tetramitiformis]